MDGPTNPARKVGIFVALTLATVAALILNFSKGATIFTPSYTIIVQSENVGGLKPGANVMMAGVPIGSVKSMDLSPDGRIVLVRCLILKRYSIHADARFEIEQSGFLGDQFVSIVPTENAGKTLADGGVVRAQSPFNLQEAARSAVGLVQKLDSAATKIDATISRVEKDLFSEQAINDLKATLANFRRVSEQGESALSEIRSLLQTNRPALEGSLSNVHRFTARLDVLANQFLLVRTNASDVLARLDGLLATNQTTLETTLGNVEAASASLRDITRDLQAGKGLAGAVLADEQLRGRVNDLVVNLVTLSSNLTKYGILYKPKQVAPLNRDGALPGRSPFR